MTAKPLQYRGETIKVCGFATKQFEDVQITTSRKGAFGNNFVGLGVDWLDEEPGTKRPEPRCVTGLIEPTCGWKNGVPADDKDIICVSTGTIYQWSIRQTELGRD